MLTAEIAIINTRHDVHINLLWFFKKQNAVEDNWTFIATFCIVVNRNYFKEIVPLHAFFGICLIIL